MDASIHLFILPVDNLLNKLMAATHSPTCLPACLPAWGVCPPSQTKDRLHGLLTAVSEELPDVPLYYTLPSLCETVHCSSPKMDDVRSALVNAGYRVSAFHKEADAIKTDAPNSVVWDIMRCW